MVAFIIKLIFINIIDNQLVTSYYFNNNTFDTLPYFLLSTLSPCLSTTFSE
jgi:hypothetical protein